MICPRCGADITEPKTEPMLEGGYYCELCHRKIKNPNNQDIKPMSPEYSWGGIKLNTQEETK